MIWQFYADSTPLKQGHMTTKDMHKNDHSRLTSSKPVLSDRGQKSGLLCCEGRESTDWKRTWGSLLGCEKCPMSLIKQQDVYICKRFSHCVLGLCTLYCMKVIPKLKKKKKKRGKKLGMSSPWSIHSSYLDCLLCHLIEELCHICVVLHLLGVCLYLVYSRFPSLS